MHRSVLVAVHRDELPSHIDVHHCCAHSRPGQGYGAQLWHCPRADHLGRRNPLQQRHGHPISALNSATLVSIVGEIVVVAQLVAKSVTKLTNQPCRCHNSEVQTEQTKLFFHRPYPHAASYFIGTALGYLMANRSIKKLARPQVLQGWLVCSVGLIVSLWGSYYWNLGAAYTQVQATLYYHLCQILWPLSIAWIILACSLGHGGLVDTILSAPIFVPLGRITYMTYLSHALIIYYHSASMAIPVEPSMLLFVSFSFVPVQLLYSSTCY